MHIPFILRNMTEDDNNFVYNSYLKSHRDSYPMKYVPDTLYYKPQAECMEFLLDTAACMIACFPEDPSEIIGWCLYQEVSEALALHYIYIKSQHRNKHIASDIIEQINPERRMIVVTHICDDYKTLKYKVAGCKVVFDPFLIDKLRDLDDAG